MELPASERVARTRAALADRTPLLERWRELDPAASAEWSPRAAHAAVMLEHANSIADLGCGHMHLERHLRLDQRYVPVDLVARDARTIVCDFNRDRLPVIPAEYFAALGLLEYAYNVDGLLQELRRHFVGGVASFFTNNASDETDRVSNGWVNHHTIGDIRSLFVTSGFALRKEFEWQNDHYLFLLQ